MNRHPEVVIVCDHAIGAGQHDEVVRYVWPERADPGRAHWGVPVAGPSGRVIETQLTGDQPGANPLSVEHLLGELRVHHEIICLGCRGRSSGILPYRSDVALLQNMFDILTTDRRFAIFAESVTDDAVTVSLGKLRRARDTAKLRCGLHV